MATATILANYESREATAKEEIKKDTARKEAEATQAPGWG